MEQQIVHSILDLIQKDINNNLTSSDINVIDPEAVYIHRTEKIALCMGILVMMKYRDLGNLRLEGYLSKDIEICMQQFPRLNTLLGSYNTNGNLLFDEWYGRFFNNAYQELSLSTVYETLLAYEWIWDTSGFNVSLDKSSRNRSGAYYTPQQLARASVRKVLDEMVFQKLDISNLSHVSNITEKQFFNLIELFSKITVIDPSCGTGHFLQAVLRYFLDTVLPHSPEFFSKEQQKVVTNYLLANLWGIDVDFIALEIAKIELMMLSSLTEEIPRNENHFIHGNPLLPLSSICYDQVNKRKLTAAGYLYHPGLQIQSEDLTAQLEVGFDLVVGNPPWEKLRFEEKSFFRPWAPHISKLSKKDDRAKEIANLLESHPLLFKYYTQFISSLETSKKLIQLNPYIRYSMAGELNTYALFTELVSHFIKCSGKVCYVIKSALVVSPVNSGIFKYLVDEKLITHCYDFINKKNIFAIDSRERFCILILGRHDDDYFYFRSGLMEPHEVFQKNDLRISPSILKLLNPLTEMIPSVSDSIELNFLIDVHSRHPVLEEVFPECKYGRLVHYTNHAEFIDKEFSNQVLPVYEGKFIELYDGRYSSYEGLSYDEKYGNKASSIAISVEAKKKPNHFPESRFFIKKEKWASLTKNYSLPYSLMWRSLTSASNRRTCIATILPHLPASQSVQFLQINNLESLVLLTALFNSVVFDYMVRLKLNGIDLTQKILKQIAVPKKERFEEKMIFSGVESSLYRHIAIRVAWLLSDDERLNSFCEKIRPKDYSYVATDRKRVISEIDILIAKTYEISTDEFKRILKSFPSFYSSEELHYYFSL